MARFNPGPRRIRKPVNLDDFSLTLITVIMIAIAAIVLITAIYGIIFALSNPTALLPDLGSVDASTDGDYPFKQDIKLNISYDTTASESISGIEAPNAVLIDVTDGEIVAGKASGGEINPASMTKVMTLIVVFENLKNEEALSDLVPVTAEHISHKSSERKLSGELGSSAYPAGNYTVKTLVHHLILDSSGVAALALADYIAGSEANFVKLMNDKAVEMGLERTTFVYCDGSHALGHKSTARDMAKIMAYAMKNTFCASVLSALYYTDSEGRVIYHKPLVHHYYQQNGTYEEISPNNAKIISAKTGWTGNVAEGWSGGCLVSYAKGANGHYYVIVVAHIPGNLYSDATKQAVKDTVSICENYIK